METLDHLTGVTDLGCSQAQGYLFATPMPIAQAPDWLQQWVQWECPRMLEVSTRRALASPPLALMPASAWNHTPPPIVMPPPAADAYDATRWR